MSNAEQVSEKVIVVTRECSGMRLDRFIADHYPSFSRAHIQRCIGEGMITLNDSVPRKRNTVREGDRVFVAGEKLKARAEKKLVAENIPLDVLYEDEGFLAINKPAGMIVHPGAGNWTGTVVNALLSRGADLSRGYEEQRPGIVHRLDKDTSGILLVAKNDRMHAALADLFTQRHIDKRYIGICAGKRPLAQEIIDAPIARSRSNPILRTVHHHGKAAQTEYELVWFQSGISVLHFRLHTGRTHQIRVHCRYAGFPILADASYGGDRGMIQRLQPLQRPLAYRVLKCFDRHALHAQSLSFVHPLTEEQVNIQAPIPEDFRNAFDVMGLESV